MEVTGHSLASARGHDEVLSTLEGVCTDRGLAALAAELAAMRAWIARDLAAVEAELVSVESQETPMHQSAQHLLALEGKRLRPMCVLLSARAGDGGGAHARDLAVAVELVHNATLLHDDVVDLGDLRRGSATARLIYGNAASIYGGDWLLVEALERIQRTGFADLLESAIAVLKSMLHAEALQLAQRGRLRTSVPDYFRVVEGKTASLFRWAFRAGARAGGLPSETCDALDAFGTSLGVAFQLVDDVLDLAGDHETVGKSMFRDLREGKTTYPLLLAMERDAAFARDVAEATAPDGVALDAALERRARAALAETRAIDDAMALARRHVADALARLDRVAPGRARDALESLAMATVARRK